MKPFLDFLVTSASLTDPSHKPTSALEITISKDPDHFLAWREHAPSRMHITSLNGPFHPDRIWSRGGIFSILLFRGVTFGSQALKDHCGYFEDIAAWNAFYDPNRPNADTYYCKPTHMDVVLVEGCQMYHSYGKVAWSC